MRYPLVIVLLVSCARAPDAPWVVEDATPPLARGLAVTPPPTVFWYPRPGLPEGSERTIRVRVTRTVRQRGPGVPAFPLRVEEDVTLDGRVVSRTDQATVLDLVASGTEVSVDPPIEAIAEELRRSRLGTPLRVTLDGAGRIRGVARHPRRGEASEHQDGPVRDLMGILERLWVAPPERPVQTGEGWSFRVSSARPLPSAGEARETLTGRYHLLGMTSAGDGTDVALAAVSLDYDIEVLGPTRGLPRVSGSGVGRGVFLLDAETGEVRVAQVVESALVRVDWPSRRRPKRVEQLSQSVFEWSVEGP